MESRKNLGELLEEKRVVVTLLSIETQLNAIPPSGNSKDSHWKNTLCHKI